jgi:hypothetical protein
VIRFRFLVPLALAGGCSWASFDNLADETWVDSVGAVKGADTNKFGANFAAASVRGAGAQMLVIGRDNADVERLAYDANGIATQKDAGDILTQLQFTHFDDLHPAMASEPGTGVVAFSLVTRGGSEITDKDANTKIVFYDVSSGDDPTFVKQVEPPMALKSNKLARGLVFGKVAGDDAHTDVIAARDDQVMIITDWALPEGNINGNPSTFAIHACKNNEPSPLTALSVALGDFDSTHAGDEVLLAVAPRLGDSGDSKIKIFPAEAVLSGDPSVVADCFDAATPNKQNLAVIDKTSANVRDLGKQMVVANFGTTAAPVLAIVASAPLSNKVFVFTGEHGATELTITPPPSAGSFGDSLAVGDLDGDGIPELAVGDSKATANGVSGAGSVFIFKFNPTAMSFTLIATLFDAQPDVEQHFGTAVAIVPFGTGAKNIVVAGDEGEVFTYFRLRDANGADIYADVRAGHQ